MAAIKYQCTVQKYQALSPTVFEILFSVDQPLTFEAGQFISVVVPGAGPNGRDLRRAYSIASAPEQSPIELCVKLVEEGPGTNYLNKLRPGDVFTGVAPYGDFLYEPKPNRHICFISTGTGVAPFRSMLLSEHFKNNPPLSATCLLGVREENEILYDQDFSEFRLHQKPIQWVKAVSRPKGTGPFFKGRVTDWLRSQGASFAWLETDYYLCGGSSMINEVKAILTERGVAKESIHQEIYYKDPVH